MSTSDSPHAEGMNGAIARQIRAEIAAAGLTDAQVAEEIGMHPTMVSRYLNCKRAMTVETVEKFANALKIQSLELVRRAVKERGQQ